MKKTKKVWLWVLTVFFALAALAYFPSFSSIFAAILAVIAIPIPKWQEYVERFIKGKVKTIIIIALAILTIFSAPQTESEEALAEDPTMSSGIMSTVETNEEPTLESTTESITQTVVTTEESTGITEATSPEKPTTPPVVINKPTEKPTEPPTNPTTEPPTEPKHTHSFTAATCTEPKTCSCGATEGSAKGHSWEDATYTNPKTCSSCNATEGSPLDVPGKENYHGHIYTGGSSSKKYHYEEKCPGKNSHEIDWDDVDRLNLEPCKTCVLK